MDVNLERYESFGWDYEILAPLTNEEVNWHTRFARVSGGPVLELACGTGRLLVEIAKAGFEVEGVELSPTMLTITEEQVAGLPAEVASRILIHNTDMTAFRLEHEFGLVLITDNSFSVLSSKEKQEACLKSVHTHLRQDGTLLVTVRRLGRSELQRGWWDSTWSEPIPHPVTQNLIRRRVASELTNYGRRVRTRLMYQTAPKDGGKTTSDFVY